MSYSSAQRKTYSILQTLKREKYNQYCHPKTRLRFQKVLLNRILWEYLRDLKNEYSSLNSSFLYLIIIEKTFQYQMGLHRFHDRGLKIFLKKTQMKLMSNKIFWEAFFHEKYLWSTPLQEHQRLVHQKNQSQFVKVACC